jgi:transposase
MGRPYSIDLRERVVGAVEKGKLSCHQAAAQFGVGVSTAITWARRFRQTGSVAPGQMGCNSQARCSPAIAFGLCPPAECANYFKNAGYAPC